MHLADRPEKPIGVSYETRYDSFLAYFRENSRNKEHNRWVIYLSLSADWLPFLMVVVSYIRENEFSRTLWNRRVWFRELTSGTVVPLHPNFRGDLHQNRHTRSGKSRLIKSSHNCVLRVFAIGTSNSVVSPLTNTCMPLL